jgi:hypothetical protein
VANRDAPNEPKPESPEVAARTVVFTILSLVAFVGLSIVGARIYYDWEVRGPVNVPPRTFAKPRLQIDDAADLAKFDQEQQAQIDGYAWVDRSQDIIQIPIDRAMAIVAAKGTGAYDPIEAPAAAANGGAPKP